MMARPWGSPDRFHVRKLWIHRKVRRSRAGTSQLCFTFAHQHHRHAWGSPGHRPAHGRSPYSVLMQRHLTHTNGWPLVLRKNSYFRDLCPMQASLSWLETMSPCRIQVNRTSLNLFWSILADTPEQHYPSRKVIFVLFDPLVPSIFLTED